MDFFGLPIQADSFHSHAELFLFSHFHRDHMVGLTRGWSRGPLLCSPVSASLLAVIERVPRRNLLVIEPEETKELSVGGRTVRVTALDANHCPGALIFVLEHDGRKIVYTGDFRLSDHLRARRALLAGAHRLYVDSTYASPEYSFPTQEESVAMVVDAVRENSEKEILLAIYTIGKNRIVEALHAEFGRPVYVTKDKLKAYEAMGYGELVTTDRRRAGFVGYSRAYFDRYFTWRNGRTPSNSLVIYPSGMCLNARPRAGFFYVPYSEHCDWAEYCEFLKMVGAGEVVGLDALAAQNDH
jgi:Cft2 family RNA processing exonuclease